MEYGAVLATILFTFIASDPFIYVVLRSPLAPLQSVPVRWQLVTVFLKRYLIASYRQNRCLIIVISILNHVKYDCVVSLYWNNSLT